MEQCETMATWAATEVAHFELGFWAVLVWAVASSLSTGQSPL